MDEINYQKKYEELLIEYRSLLEKYEALKIKHYGSERAADYHEEDRTVKDKADYNHWHLGIGLGGY